MYSKEKSKRRGSFKTTVWTKYQNKFMKYPLSMKDRYYITLLYRKKLFYGPFFQWIILRGKILFFFFCILVRMSLFVGTKKSRCTVWWRTEYKYQNHVHTPHHFALLLYITLFVCVVSRMEMYDRKESIERTATDRNKWMHTTANFYDYFLICLDMPTLMKQILQV